MTVRPRVPRVTVPGQHRRRSPVSTATTASVRRHRAGQPATGPATGPATRSFRADAQALRALAVLLVILHHAGVPGVRTGYVGVDASSSPGSSSPPTWPPRAWLAAGVAMSAITVVLAAAVWFTLPPGVGEGPAVTLAPAADLAAVQADLQADLTTQSTGGLASTATPTARGRWCRRRPRGAVAARLRPGGEGRRVARGELDEVVVPAVGPPDPPARPAQPRVRGVARRPGLGAGHRRRHHRRHRRRPGAVAVLVGHLR